MATAPILLHAAERPAPRQGRCPMPGVIRWIVLLASLALLGSEVAAEFRSPSLGFLAAGLMFLLLVSLHGAVAPRVARRG
jgi:hypothetical protein